MIAMGGLLLLGRTARICTGLGPPKYSPPAILPAATQRETHNVKATVPIIVAVSRRQPTAKGNK